MRVRLVRALSIALVAAALVGSTPLVAQWLKYPTAGVPRTKDGKVDLKAPTPRTREGKPDFSGIWLSAEGAECASGTPSGQAQGFIECGIELPFPKEGFSMGSGMPGGLPYQPAAAAAVKQNMAENSRSDPHARCLPDTFVRSYSLPHLTKYVQTPGLLVTLNEVNAMYRQVFLDGRPLPEDPTPAWNGYSTAKWEGDTLVIDSIGFRDGLWIDMSGSTISSAAKVRERLRRPDYGHLEIEITVDDPKTYTKPWTVTLTHRIVVDTDLIDEVCLENEKSAERMLKTP
jgi:hypothetical protein